MDIKIICRQHGTSLKCVAQRLGMYHSNLGRLMRGNPTLSLIVRVAEALDMPPHELLRQLLTDD